MAVLVVLLSIVALCSAGILSVSEGGTNSGTVLTNNKAVCSLGGAIKEASSVSCTDSSFKIGQAGVTTGTNNPGKFVLQGTTTSVPNGPHIMAYTNLDAHPLRQDLNWAHNNIKTYLDCYWNGSQTISSNAVSNYVFDKVGTSFKINVAKDIAAGSVISSFNVAMEIHPTGVVNIPQLTWQSVGLRHTAIVSTNGAVAGTTNLYASKVNNVVTLTLKGLKGTVTSSNNIFFDLSNLLPTYYWPKISLTTTGERTSFPVIVNDGAFKVGRFELYYYFEAGEIPFPSGPHMSAQIHAPNTNGYFTTGSDRGFGDISISYISY